MIDPETQDTPTQLPLPAGFLEPGPQRWSPEPPPARAVDRPEPPADAAVEDLIQHFRAVARRSESAKGDSKILTGLLRRWRDRAASPRQPDRDDIWPRLSIILPILDPEVSVDDAIASLVAQSYPDLELILVSPFDTARLLGALPGDGLRVVALAVSQNAGLVTALRRGFARASGEVLGCIDAGTTVLPGTLARVGRHFRAADAEAVFVMDVVREVKGWRFAAESGLDPAALYVSRLKYDVVGGLDPGLDDAASAVAIATALATPIAARYGLQRIPIHAAVVRRAADADGDRAPPDVGDIVASGTSPDFWFAPERTEAVPAQDITVAVAPAPSPIDGTAPQRLLFASPDTRFGAPGLHDVWYHADSHCTATAPVVGRSEVRRLAAQQPPLSERRIIEPDPDAPSPWRDWRFGAWFLGFALDHPLPGWLLDRWPLKLALGWTDRTGLEIEKITAGLLPGGGKNVAMPLRALEVGCHSGDVLDHLHRAGWKTYGTELNVAAAEAARAKGHTIWAGAPDDILQTVPLEERFDLIFLGHVVERQADPFALVQRAARLLTPTGLVVIATPNLDSAQIRLFGPTWAHWHPPYHRAILSRRTLELIAAASGLRLRRCRSWSHPYWSWLSVRLNRAGLAGIVPNGIVPDSETRSAVETLILGSRLLYDWRGRGDYLFAALAPDTRP